MKTETYDRLSKTYSKLPKLDAKLLWHDDYWDGPTSGLCDVNGEKLWFELIEEYCDNHGIDYDDMSFVAPWYRRFLVIRLDPNALLDHEERHRKFQKLVGEHTDYNDGGERVDLFEYNDTINKDTVASFYEEAKRNPEPEINPEDQDVLGWFEL